MNRVGTPLGTALVLFATTTWGISGLFVTELVHQGLRPVQVVYYANGLSFVALFSLLAIFAPRYLRVPGEVLPAMLGLGIVGGGLSFVFYAEGIAAAGVSLTTLLNYTAPIWVTLLAWRFLGESIGWRHLAAVLIGLAGSALVARVYDPAALQASTLGIFYGLASGFTYSLYNVLGKHVLTRFHPLTVTVYAMGASTLALMAASLLRLIPLQPIPLPLGVAPSAYPWIAAQVLGPGLLGPIAFNTGLRSLLASLVALLSMWELVIAVGLGVLVLGESLDAPQALGALLVASCVLLLRPRGDAQAQPTAAAKRPAA